MYSCTLKQSPKETVVEKGSILELMCRENNTIKQEVFRHITVFKTFFPLAIQLEQIIKIGLKSTQKTNKERVQKLSSKRMPTAPTVLGMARKLKGVAGSFYFYS